MPNAYVVTHTEQFLSGRWMVVGTCTGDASYVGSGGEVEPTPAELGLTAITSLVFNGNSAGFSAERLSGKVKVFWADNDAVADSALIEVLATTDLSSMTLPFVAYGTGT